MFQPQTPQKVTEKGRGMKPEGYRECSQYLRIGIGLTTKYTKHTKN
jgi:hypothetical protein